MRVLLVLIALAVAGCVGGEDGAPSAVEQTLETLTGPDPATLPGSIEGVVTTAALEPIGGARITLLRENVSTSADASGWFRFADLRPGEYLMGIEADGYRARTIVTQTRNGTVTEMNVTLEAAPRLVARHETVELNGFLACGAEASSPAGLHEYDCAAADPNHKSRFEFHLAPTGKRVVLELTWSVEDNPGVQRLRLHAETVGYGANDIDLGEAVGEGYARVVVPQDVMEKFYPEGGAMRATVELVGAEAPAVALQTRFTVFATTFYVEPGAEDFRVVA